MEMRGQQSWKTNRAQVLRSQLTASEVTMWRELRDRRLDGFKFTRQVPIRAYFADFVCRSQKVVVEIDGATHSTDAEQHCDATRTAFLEAAGYRVFRAHNAEITENLSGVLNSLLVLLRERE